MNKKTPRDQLPYSLHRLTFILQRQSDEILQKELGIGFSQFKLMIGLSKHPRCEQQQLAMYLGQTEASISRQIRLMDKMSLVSVQSDKEDKRRRHVVLTTKGNKVFENAQKLLESQHRAVLKSLNDNDIKRFQKNLDDLLLAVGCPEDTIGNY